MTTQAPTMPVTLSNDTVAICVRCGREFVTLPAGKIMLDPYPPQGRGRAPKEKGDFAACLGRLHAVGEKADKS